MSAILETLALFAVSLMVPAAAGQQNSLSMKTLSQPGAPLQVAGTFFTDTSLTVLLVNVSAREVKQATMGMVLEDEASVVPPVTRTGRACEATVPPDGFLVVKEGNIGFDTAASYFRSKGITKKGAAIGVTHVRFADGSDWTYPLDAKGHFDEQVDETINQKVQSLFQRQFPDKDIWAWFLGPGRGGKVSTCRKLTEEPIPAKVR
jgi:hypothetical protein